MNPAPLDRISMQRNRFRALCLCLPKNFTFLAKKRKEKKHFTIFHFRFLSVIYTLLVWNTTFKSELLFTAIYGKMNNLRVGYVRY